MKCKKCNKLLKENTYGNLKYCQGHSICEDFKAVNKGLGNIEDEIDKIIISN